MKPVRRFVLIAFVLALLAFAGVRAEEYRSTAPGTSTGSTSQFGAPPAPDMAWPAVMSAALPTSATVQMRLVSAPDRDTSADHGVFTAARAARLVPYGTARPLFFPLLI